MGAQDGSCGTAATRCCPTFRLQPAGERADEERGLQHVRRGDGHGQDAGRDERGARRHGHHHRGPAAHHTRCPRHGTTCMVVPAPAQPRRARPGPGHQPRKVPAGPHAAVVPGCRRACLGAAFDRAVLAASPVAAWREACVLAWLAEGAGPARFRGLDALRVLASHAPLSALPGADRPRTRAMLARLAVG